MSEKETVDSARIQQSSEAGSLQPKNHLQSQLAEIVYPLSHSPWPIWSLSAFFAGTSLAGLNPALPPLFQRLGFSAIFAGTGYVLSTGDIKNGSGIATAWSGIYLLSNQLRKVAASKTTSQGAKFPRHPLGWLLTGATLISTAIYGGEYFWFENFDKETK